MTKNNLNTNKQFMLGNGILAFAVFAIVIIFLYMSFRFKRDANKIETFDESFNIEITKDLAGDSIAIYINDSLLLDKKMPNTNTKLSIKRFADDNVLMIVDKKTDETTPYNLSTKKTNIKIDKVDGNIKIEDN